MKDPKLAYYLKLRSNILLEGDVSLAEEEAKHFFESVTRVFAPSIVRDVIGLPETIADLHARECQPIGFIARGTLYTMEMLVLQFNFVQEIWRRYTPEDDELIGRVPWVTRITYGEADFICAVPLMAAGEILSQSNLTQTTQETLRALVTFLATGRQGKFHLVKPNGGSTSTQHVHGLHAYKAKFFPRLIRSLMVTSLPSLPRTPAGNVSLLDPFVGSGTALVEGSMLGFESHGVDIDKLSCAISQAKLDALRLDQKFLSQSIAELSSLIELSQEDEGYTFPPIIAKKFDRKGKVDEKRMYEVSIARWKRAITGITNPDARRLLEICLSDALTRKFNVRMMGTGVGRFALEVSKKSIDSIMRSNLSNLLRAASVAKTIVEGYRLRLAPSSVRSANAAKLPYEPGRFSLIVTSPPYLPASSGREDYLVGKLISITALGLMSEEEIHHVETESIGSMKSTPPAGDGLPDSVHKLYNWLLTDSLRSIKAQPILAYYDGLKKALEESYRVLLPNGLAIYVIGKESVFYTYRTREVLYRVPCDDIFGELATSCGFIVEKRVDVELDKKNRNARPRSMDKYYESIFFLRKPR